jgi:integrase
MLKKAHLPHMTVHDLRHTASYLLEREGAPESARMALLGHSTATMARHYSDHATIQDMRDLFKKSA